MCGIAGIYSMESSVNEHLIKKMTDSIQHRGPDAEGVWISDDKCIGLGHRRLSIIDTSDLGNQPFHFLDRYTIVFNGEIYNYIELREQLVYKGYTFKSKTDTEVLLALYDLKKEECLTDLDGMFAFCIWDQKERTLFCARDRFGEKPFYYSYLPGKHFIFASEMKALFAHGLPKNISNKMVYNYLADNWIENPTNKSETFYEDIFKLEASHYITINDRALLKKQKYWKLNPETQININLDDAVIRFKELLNASVKKRLRSDVAIGSSLSGGLDSSTIVGILSSLHPHSQHTFSACFPGYEKDETSYMQMVISKGNIHPHFTIPNADQLADQLDLLFYHQEEPFASTSIFAQWKVMQLAKENSTIVLLDGQGADELLAGYTFYYRSFFQELYATDTTTFQKEYTDYKAWQGNHFSLDWKFKLQAKFPELYNFYLQLRSGPIQHPDIHPDFYQHYKSSTYPPAVFKPSLNNHLHTTLCVSGFESLLRYADRNSMAFSREVRLPYLDHQLVEFCYSLPSTFKIHKGWSKYLLRKAYEGVIPKEITWRKDKIGYAPPESEWMQAPRLKQMLEDGISHLIKEKIIASNQLNKNKTWTYLMVSKILKNA